MAAPDDLDEAVIRAARDGDEAAFTRLYRATQPWLVKYVAVLAGRDVDDVCAETWLQVCRDLRTFHGDVAGFRAWIVRIARNRSIDAARRRNRRPVDLAASDEPPPTITHESAEDAAITSMTTAATLRIIGQLPREQAEAVLLRSVLGLDARTAAAMLGRRPGAVRTAAYRGLRELSRRLTDVVGATTESPSLTAPESTGASDVV